jgi:hypothetical protein
VPPAQCVLTEIGPAAIHHDSTSRERFGDAHHLERHEPLSIGQSATPTMMVGLPTGLRHAHATNEPVQDVVNRHGSRRGLHSGRNDHQEKTHDQVREDHEASLRGSEARQGTRIPFTRRSDTGRRPISQISRRLCAGEPSGDPSVLSPQSGWFPYCVSPVHSSNLVVGKACDEPMPLRVKAHGSGWPFANSFLK